MRAFAVDKERSGALIEQVEGNADLFEQTFGDISPVGFACVAWRLATPPWLDPGYVRWERRVLSATCDRSPWDGGLIAHVSIVSPWPAELTWSRQWGRDRGWRDWPQVFGQYVHPAEQDVARDPHLMATLTVQAPLPLDRLPVPPEGRSGDLADRALRSAAVVARDLNDLLEPILAQLDAPVPAPGDTAS